jgi:hypothetical protein
MRGGAATLPDPDFRKPRLMPDRSELPRRQILRVASKRTPIEQGSAIYGAARGGGIVAEEQRTPVFGMGDRAAVKDRARISEDDGASRAAAGMLQGRRNQLVHGFVVDAAGVASEPPRGHLAAVDMEGITSTYQWLDHQLVHGNRLRGFPKG